VSLVELNLIRPENGNVNGKEKLLFFSEKETCLARKQSNVLWHFYCESLLLSDTTEVKATLQLLHGWLRTPLLHASKTVPRGKLGG